LEPLINSSIKSRKIKILTDISQATSKLNSQMFLSLSSGSQAETGREEPDGLVKSIEARKN